LATIQQSAVAGASLRFATHAITPPRTGADDRNRVRGRQASQRRRSRTAVGPLEPPAGCGCVRLIRQVEWCFAPEVEPVKFAGSNRSKRSARITRRVNWMGASWDDEYLTVKEIADRLKLNQQTVRNWI
jgi:hypothetical protein